MKNNQTTSREAVRIAIASDYEANKDLTPVEVREIIGEAYDAASEACAYHEYMFGRHECTVKVLMFKTN